MEIALKNTAEQGIFLTVEGGEGVGKTVLCQGLVAELEKRGSNVFSTREPGGTKVGKSLREIFLSPPGGDPLCTLTELFLISAGRSQHVQGPILENLALGHFVICDRFYDSTRVYQGLLGGIRETEIESVLKVSVDGLTPYVTFLLDCDIEVIMRRLSQRHEQEESSRFDAAPKEYHQRLRQAFLRVAKTFPDRFVVLDAGQDPSIVREEAVAELIKRGILN
jgi:dTMP kinase